MPPTVSGSNCRFWDRRSELCTLTTVLVGSRSKLARSYFIGILFISRGLYFRFSIFMYKILIFILFPHDLHGLTLVRNEVTGKLERGSESGCGHYEAQNLKNGCSESSFETRFWPFEKRSCLKKVRRVFRAPDSSKCWRAWFEETEQAPSSIWVLSSISEIPEHECLLTFFKQLLFSNGQNLISKLLSERPFLRFWDS